MASTLESYVNRMVSIITTDGRNFVGTLKGFDQTINIILEDTHERVFSASAGVEQVMAQECNPFGTIFSMYNIYQ